MEKNLIEELRKPSTFFYPLEIDNKCFAELKSVLEQHGLLWKYSMLVEGKEHLVLGTLAFRQKA